MRTTAGSFSAVTAAPTTLPDAACAAAFPTVFAVFAASLPIFTAFPTSRRAESNAF